MEGSADSELDGDTDVEAVIEIEVEGDSAGV